LQIRPQRPQSRERRRFVPLSHHRYCGTIRAPQRLGTRGHFQLPVKELKFINGQERLIRVHLPIAITITCKAQVNFG